MNCAQRQIVLCRASFCLSCGWGGLGRGWRDWEVGRGGFAGGWVGGWVSEKYGQSELTAPHVESAGACCRVYAAIVFGCPGVHARCSAEGPRGRRGDGGRPASSPFPGPQASGRRAPDGHQHRGAFWCANCLHLLPLSAPICGQFARRLTAAWAGRAGPTGGQEPALQDR